MPRIQPSPGPASSVSDSAVATQVTSGTQTTAALRAAFAPYLPQFHGVRYTAYGHSFGQVQSPVNTWAGGLYPARLRDLLRADSSLYANQTVSGSTMTQIASKAASTWTDGNGGLVTLMGNQNSVGNHQDATSFKADVRSFLTTILGSTGHPPTVLVIKDTTCTSVGYARYSTPPTDADVAAYNGYLTSVVGEFPAGWIVVADPIADGWNPATMTAPDGQHPNDRGMALIAASCLKALAASDYRQGQNLGVVSSVVPSPVLTPTALTIAATPGNGQVTITGSGGSGQSVTYALYRGTTPTGTPIATSFPFTDTGLTNGTTYSYVATATNTAGTVTSAVVTAQPTGGSSSTYVSDSFNRANSASSPGSADIGGAWSVYPGNTYGISSNKLYPIALNAFPPDCTIDDAHSDGTVQVTLSGPIAAPQALAFRLSSDNLTGYFFGRATVSATTYSLMKRTAANTYITLGTSAVAPVAGDVVSVVLAGSSITCKVNGSTAVTATDSTYTGTKHGVWTNNLSALFDDYSHTS